MYKSRRNLTREAGPSGLYVVVCSDEIAVGQIAECLSEKGDGKILSFSTSTDLTRNLPVFNVNLLVIAGEHSEEELHRILAWSRRFWPDGVKVVVGEPGDFQKEIVTRKHAAFYLTKPTSKSDWDGVLEGVTQTMQSA